MDMHSNASVTMLNIKISKQLLEHHAGKAGEIKAILMHEITHWKEMHLIQ
jgi:Zn-dependent protease with chaperone function